MCGSCRAGKYWLLSTRAAFIEEKAKIPFIFLTHASSGARVIDKVKIYIQNLTFRTYNIFFIFRVFDCKLKTNVTRQQMMVYLKTSEFAAFLLKGGRMSCLQVSLHQVVFLPPRGEKYLGSNRKISNIILKAHKTWIDFSKSWNTAVKME